MKFGKRRHEDPAAGARDGDTTAPDSAPAAPEVTESWTQPPAASSPNAEPTAPAQPLGYAEPVVEGEAVELPPVEPAAPVYEPPMAPTLHGSLSTSEPIASPVDEQPVAAVESAGPVGGASASSLGDAGEAFASGHAAAPPPSWQEPLQELADERPELVVAAAFAGGILAAMILRRLGS